MDMGSIRVAAQAYYAGSTESQKQAAQKFFKAIDSDNNGNISVDEFSTFLTFAGFQSEKFAWLFGELDKDKNGTLDFEEMLTFFYILSRDEYRDLLKSRANTGVPRREAGPPSQNQRPNWADVLQLFSVLLGAYELGHTVSQGGCSIL